MINKIFLLKYGKAFEFMIKTCAFTGHRDLPENKINNIKIRLEQEIDKAIAEGYNHFISGGASGIDIIAARIVTEKIDFDENIKLSLILPFENFMNFYDLCYLQPYCHKISYIHKDYCISAYYDRDKKMVEMADMLIGYYDNRGKGGTYATIKYAEKKGIETKIIYDNDIPEDL